MKTDLTSETVCEWQFDRYRNGRLKAQGVTVHTAGAAEAWIKAKELLYIDGNLPTDELRPRWKSCEGIHGALCGRPVYGYVEERCCSGHECGCMGLPLSPCWCAECWATYDREAKARAEVFAKEFDHG